MFIFPIFVSLIVGLTDTWQGEPEINAGNFSSLNLIVLNWFEFGYVFVLFIYLGGGTGDWTQGLGQTRQALYQLSHIG